MSDILGGEIKTRIEQFLSDPGIRAKASDPDTLKKIRIEFAKKTSRLRHNLGDAYSDLETFHDMLFDETFTLDKKTAALLVAVMIFFLNPFDFIPEGIPLLGLVDDRLVIAIAARACSGELLRFCAHRKRE